MAGEPEPLSVSEVEAMMRRQCRNPEHTAGCWPSYRLLADWRRMRAGLEELRRHPDFACQTFLDDIAAKALGRGEP